MNSHEHSLERATVYLLRHGDCRQDDIRRYVGQGDLPLNAEGRSQAARWRDRLADIHLERVFCSDLSRSCETASIIARGRGVQVRPLAKLREIGLGSWDGLPISEVRRLYPLEYEKRGADMAYYRPPGGECFADLAARVIPLFEELVRSTSGNLLIVGHSGVNKVLLCHILGMPLENLFRIRQDYGCLNVIDIGREGMRVRQLNMGSDDLQSGITAAPALNLLRSPTACG
jgi:alpha-ribazole phosphatase